MTRREFKQVADAIRTNVMKKMPGFNEWNLQIDQEDHDNANYFCWLVKNGSHREQNVYAHYELRTDKKFPEKIFLDLHFEGERPEYQKVFVDKFPRNLPKGLIWHNWRTFPGIRYERGIGIRDSNIGEQFLKAFSLLNRVASSRIQQGLAEIIGTLPVVTPVSATNTILYGPPGTGKTYSTKQKALALIAPGFSGSNREEVNRRFNEYVEAGQIVFTTFHQSMSYEDFVEGIKPLAPEEEGGPVRYQVVSGIFHQICNRAGARVGQTNFAEAYSQLATELADSGPVRLKTRRGAEFEIAINSKGNLNLHTGQDFRKQGVLTQDNIKQQFDGIRISFDGWGGYFDGVISLLQERYNLSKTELKNPQYVLIIDEINRGNVSQIFGELITLIEPDKRIGSKEAITLTLPYSKESFGVPANVHIIGTMNTADRSIEALDSALRRRFTFEEIRPQPELLKPNAIFWRLLWKYADAEWEDPVYIAAESGLLDLLGGTDALKDNLKYSLWDIFESEGEDPDQIKRIPENEFYGINLADLLTTINARIEKLLDRDHQIGHSYFMQVQSWADLEFIFRKNIVPLLQEYFFGDYGKIRLVLGDGFCQAKDNQVRFAVNDMPEYNDYSNRAVYELFPAGFNIQVAIEMLWAK